MREGTEFGNLAPMAGEAGVKDVVAIPYPDFAAAATSVIEQLARDGLGTWVLRPVGLDNAGPVTIPLVLPDGSLLGTLKALDIDPSVHRRAVEVAETFARLLASVAAAERRAERAAQQAAHAEAASMADGLTGLPNRRAWHLLLEREAARCRRSSSRAVIALVDLDDLKTVNDAHGHLAGDILIRTAGEVVRSTVRRSDGVARIGGDEFAVVAVDYDEPVPRTLLERLAKALANEGISASIGVVVHEAHDDIEASFERADAAMYADKRRRKALPFDA